MSNSKDSDISYAIRWRPDFRYVSEKFVNVSLNNFKSTEPSVTDKEAYRLTLSSLRGEIAQGSGKIDVGHYSLKAGEDYKPEFDFSFLNRKDLTIVELDDYIAHYKKIVEDYDAELTQDVKEQLAKMQVKKEQLQKSQDSKNSEVEK